MEFLVAEWIGKPVWMWLGFHAVIFILLALDLGLLHRDKSREIGVKADEGPCDEDQLCKEATAQRHRLRIARLAQRRSSVDSTARQRCRTADTLVRPKRCKSPCSAADLTRRYGSGPQCNLAAQERHSARVRLEDRAAELEREGHVQSYWKSEAQSYRANTERRARRSL